MEKYESYKPSGVEWIGEIPEEWKVVRIKMLSSVKRGASPRPIDDPKYFDEDGKYAWVRIADVSASSRYLDMTTQRLSELGSDLSVKMEPGEFFLSIAGSVGKPIITKIKACIHDGFVYFPTLDINPEYLYYVFETGLPYKGLGKWGTQLNLNTETVGNISIALPANNIDSIVSYLDRKTALIDSLIDKTERKIELLKEKRIALINQAVTKGLDPNVPMKDSGVEWIGEIPEHWEMPMLKYLANIENGRDYKDFEVESGGYPVYGTGGEFARCSKCLFEGVKSVLLGRKGTVDKPMLIEGPFWTSDTIYYTIIKEIIEADYFYYLCLQIPFKLYSYGSAIPSMTKTDYVEMKFPLPPKPEQQSINSFLKINLSRIDEVYKVERIRIEKLKEYRQALISEVVTGKIKVSADD
jgi:type I restriction enzyme S subunit